MKALGKIVLIKPIQQNITKGGIIVPDKVKKMLSYGEVIDIGPDCPKGAIEIGDKVHYNPNAIGELGDARDLKDIIAVGIDYIISKEEEGD